MSDALSYHNINAFKAAIKALDHNIPFALFILPGENIKLAHFLATIPDKEPISPLCFAITPWNESTSDNIHITDTIDVDEFIAASYLPKFDNTITLNVNKVSTSRESHTTQVTYLKELLTHIPMGKVVLSRILCGSIRGWQNNDTWIDVAFKYFQYHPNTLRYIYYTPYTGGWIAASPELLLNVDKKSGQASTISLAGTRYKLKDKYTWDAKNIEEHNIVSQFISNELIRLGLSFEIRPVDDVHFGSISHLCDLISFNIGQLSPTTILDILSPTPALSGYPRPDALKIISNIEAHSRHCYGGYVSINSYQSFIAYVNLRCIHFHNSDYCIYAGGGITSQSIPDEEWYETEQKMHDLKQLLSEV